LALSGTELKILTFDCIFSSNFKMAATLPQR